MWSRSASQRLLTRVVVFIHRAKPTFQSAALAVDTTSAVVFSSSRSPCFNCASHRTSLISASSFPPQSLAKVFTSSVCTSSFR